MDLATVPALREVWVEAIEAVHPAVFVVDLTNVTFLDSTALGAIIRVYKRQREHGGEVLVVSASPSVMKVFRITHLDWLLDLSVPERAFRPRPPAEPRRGVNDAGVGFAPRGRGQVGGSSTVGGRGVEVASDADGRSVGGRLGTPPPAPRGAAPGPAFGPGLRCVGFVADSMMPPVHGATTSAVPGRQQLTLV